LGQNWLIKHEKNGLFFSILFIMLHILWCDPKLIVNVNNLSKVTGNSQGYKLFFNIIDFSIPVSRERSKKLFKLLA